MPLTIPAFQQYQEPITPLNARWRQAPPEGDKAVTLALDWATMGGPSKALQITAGNNPQQFSQIVAMYVDNRRCGVDVAFQFVDTGFLLEVPAHDQGLYPVLTNALQFFIVATGATTGDTTIVQVLNSLPPPISILPTQAQNNAAASGVSLAGPSSTPLIAAGISGTLNGFSLTVATTAAGSVEIALRDGTGALKWSGIFVGSAGGSNVTVNLSDIGVRFTNGLNVVVANSAGGIAGSATMNVYYQTP